MSRLEHVNAPTELAWSGRTFGIRAVHTWRFEESEGGTRVRTAESFEGLLARLLPGLMNRMLAKALDQGLGALKAEAEARHALREPGYRPGVQ